MNDILTGADCGLDIYEEPDENKWVECQMRKSRMGLYIIVPILIVIVILFIWLGSPALKIGAVVIGGGLIALAVASHIYWTPTAARVQHKRFQREVESYMRDGVTRAQAIDKIRDEHLKREVARTQANATLSGAALIAGALRRR